MGSKSAYLDTWFDIFEMSDPKLQGGAHLLIAIRPVLVDGMPEFSALLCQKLIIVYEELSEESETKPQLRPGNCFHRFGICNSLKTKEGKTEIRVS